MKKITVIGLAMLMIFSANCTWVHRTYLKPGKVLRSDKPSYEASRAFFVGGLIGRPELNVNDICGTKEAVAIETMHSFGDKLLTGITLFFYAPFTIRVYCE